MQWHFAASCQSYVCFRQTCKILLTALTRGGDEGARGGRHRARRLGQGRAGAVGLRAEGVSVPAGRTGGAW